MFYKNLKKKEKFFQGRSRLKTSRIAQEWGKFNIRQQFDKLSKKYSKKTNSKTRWKFSILKQKFS